MKPIRFVSTSKEIKDNISKNINDGVQNLDIAAYHDGVISSAVSLYYDIQLQNINNAIKSIYEDDNPFDPQIDRAFEIHTSLGQLINFEFEKFSNSSTVEKSRMFNNGVLKDISVDSLNDCRNFIKTQVSELGFSKNILSDISARLNNRNANTANYIEFMKKYNYDFKTKSGRMLEELIDIADNNIESPEVKQTNKILLK